MKIEEARKILITGKKFYEKRPFGSQLNHVVTVTKDEDIGEELIITKRWLKKGWWHYDVNPLRLFIIGFDYGLRKVAELRPNFNK